MSKNKNFNAWCAELDLPIPPLSSDILVRMKQEQITTRLISEEDFLKHYQDRLDLYEEECKVSFMPGIPLRDIPDYENLQRFPGNKNPAAQFLVVTATQDGNGVKFHSYRDKRLVFEAQGVARGPAAILEVFSAHRNSKTQIIKAGVWLRADQLQHEANRQYRGWRHFEELNGKM